MKKNFSRVTALALAIGMVASVSASAVYATSDKDMQKLTYKNYDVGPYDAPRYGLIEGSQKFVKVSTSHLGGIILDDKGIAYTWGKNCYGQIGVGKQMGYDPGIGNVNITAKQKEYISYCGGLATLDFFTNPERYAKKFKEIGIEPTLTAPTAIVDVAGGYEFMAAVDEQGRVWSWGYNGYHTAGMPEGTVSKSNCLYDFPQLVKGLPNNIVSVVCSQGIACFERVMAIDADGGLWVWGSNSYGLHGSDSKKTDSAYMATPHKAIFPAGTKIVQAEAGAEHSVALDSEGNIWTWGNSSWGYLGDGKDGVRYKPAMISLPGGAKATQISSTAYNTMALAENGDVYQWGYVYDTGTTHKKPVKITVAKSEIARVGYTPKAVSIASGYKTYHFIDQHGRSWSWGWNIFTGFGMEGGAIENECVFVKEAYQYPAVIGDGDTQLCTNKDKKTPANGLNMNKTYKTYGIWDVHPTIYDKRYNEGEQTEKVEFWKKYALSTLPQMDSISSDLFSFAALDKDGNAYVWTTESWGSLCLGWDYKKGYAPNGNARDGMHFSRSNEVIPMLSYPSEIVSLPGKEGFIDVKDSLLDENGNAVPGNPAATTSYKGADGKMGTIAIDKGKYLSFNSKRYVFDEEKTLQGGTVLAGDSLSAVYTQSHTEANIFYSLDSDGDGKPDYKEERVYLEIWLKDAQGAIAATPAERIVFYKDDIAGAGDTLTLHADPSYVYDTYFPIDTKYPDYAYDWIATSQDASNSFTGEMNKGSFISAKYGLGANAPTLKFYFGYDSNPLDNVPDYYSDSQMQINP
jgi:alpha-tubulin suppressor-like RCC1 family protein